MNLQTRRIEQEREREEGNTPDSLISAIPSSTTPGMADKRQLNLNHEYERGEREGGQDGGLGERKRERDEESRGKPRQQSGGSFVTVMASTPGLQPPRLAPPSRLPANTRPTRAQLSRSRFTYPKATRSPRGFQ